MGDVPKLRQPLDYAPLIARVVCENPPEGMGTDGMMKWARTIWPEAMTEEITRAFLIADEIELADRLAQVLR